MKIKEFVALFPALCLQCLVLGRADDGSVHEVLQWLISNGATLNEAVGSNFFMHGGANVRGLLTSRRLPKQTNVMFVPRRLWLEPNSFPEFVHSKLPSSCDVGGAYWENELKFAAALAAEVEKGASSFHYTYLKHLPSMEEFHSFIPWMMEESLQADFPTLPLVDYVRSMQAHFKAIESCFDSWAKTDNSPAKGLTWEQTLLAISWLRTRSYTIHDPSKQEGVAVLIPGCDMVNTAEGAELNVGYEVSQAGFAIKTQGTPLSAASELEENYCSNCTNSEMVKHWGVYLEKNPFPIEPSPESCDGEDFDSNINAMFTKKSTLAALEDPAPAIAAGLRSPRCHANIWSTKQGPLRCALARLAWETCAEEWGIAPVHHVAPVKNGAVGQTGSGSPIDVVAGPISRWLASKVGGAGKQSGHISGGSDVQNKVPSPIVMPEHVGVVSAWGKKGGHASLNNDVQETPKIAEGSHALVVDVASSDRDSGDASESDDVEQEVAAEAAEDDQKAGVSDDEAAEEHDADDDDDESGDRQSDIQKEHDDDDGEDQQSDNQKDGDADDEAAGEQDAEDGGDRQSDTEKDEVLDNEVADERDEDDDGDSDVEEDASREQADENSDEEQIDERADSDEATPDEENEDAPEALLLTQHRVSRSKLGFLGNAD